MVFFVPFHLELGMIALHLLKSFLGISAIFCIASNPPPSPKENLVKDSRLLFVIGLFFLFFIF
jgi:hypothetical protein